MKKIAVLLAEGFEEVEALTVVDLLRRARIACDMVALADADRITGSHGITVLADACFSNADLASYDGIVLPGGQPGTAHLAEDARLPSLLQRFFREGKLTAAICAAPSVLAKAGLLDGKPATCYPGVEAQLAGALYSPEPVMRDGTVITGRAVGSAIPFALSVTEYLEGPAAAETLRKAIVY